MPHWSVLIYVHPSGILFTNDSFVPDYLPDLKIFPQRSSVPSCTTEPDPYANE